MRELEIQFSDKATVNLLNQNDLIVKNLARYETTKPEMIFEWQDKQTTAKGWLVIDSLCNGAAGGGTRMHEKLDKEEVIALAKTMGLKFSAIGMPIGGAKSGINFDPNSPQKGQVLERWYKAIKPILKSCYGTGGDLNVDEINEVIPVTKKIGMLHPQEGIVRGYFKLNQSETGSRINQLIEGVSKVVQDPAYAPNSSEVYKVADMVTGYGVAEAIKYFYLTYHHSFANKKVIIQGWGNVGSAAGYYLAKNGFQVVGVIEQKGALINEEGFSFKEIEKLFVDRKNILATELGQFIPGEEVDNKVWDIGAEVFIPAAASKLIEINQIDRLIQSGLEVIAPGANVPFNDADIFYGEVCRYADKKVSLIPDFISNCGMAEVFWYLMREKIQVDENKIFEDISSTIQNLFERSFMRNGKTTYLTKTFLQMFLKPEESHA